MQTVNKGMTIMNILVAIILAVGMAFLGLQIVCAKVEQDGNLAGSQVMYQKSADGSIVAIGSSSSWATARTNVATNDSATTYGTNDTGNFSVSGYNKVRFRIFMNTTTDSMSFACGSATPTTNPYYGYTPVVSVSGYSTTAPFICDCYTNGQTVMFPRVTGLSSGGNVTSIKYQLYN